MHRVLAHPVKTSMEGPPSYLCIQDMLVGGTGSLRIQMSPAVQMEDVCPAGGATGSWLTASGFQLEPS